MFEEPLDLSSDLEWMLQSGQIALPQLVHYLVQETYPSLFQLAFLIHQDINTAHQAVEQTLLNAIENAPLYHGEKSVHQWLMELLIRRHLKRNIFQKIYGKWKQVFSKKEVEINSAHAITSPLQEQNRYPAFSPNELEQIAEGLLKKAIKRQQNHRFWRAIQVYTLLMGVTFLLIALARAQGVFNTTPAHSNNILSVETEKQAERIIHVIHITLTPVPSSTPTPHPENAILYTVSQGETLRNIAQKIGIDLQLLQAFNAVQPDDPLPEGHTLIIGFGSPPLSLITPTPITPIPLPIPLTVHSSQEDIRTRLLNSHRNWHTLWADALTIDYGPLGYVGPAAIYRSQVWISQPLYTLLLCGDASGHPERVSLTVAGRVTDLDIRTGQRSYNRNGGLFDTDLQELLLPDSYRYPPESIFEVIGTDYVARRFALMVDHFRIDRTFIDSNQSEIKSRLGRYWVDVLTGIVLRKQEFDSSNPNLLIKEIVIKELTLDANIPNRLFDPYQPLITQFAMDFRGEPDLSETSSKTTTGSPSLGRAPLPHVTPPPDFDPSLSQLTFQYTHLKDIGDSTTRADLFADRFYLGNIPFADPRRINCVRSLNGNLIAFSEWLEQPPYGASSAKWFDLRTPTKVHDPQPGLSTSQFAFSPDSQNLALIACDKASSCGIYILNLHTNEAHKILPIQYGYGISWSPDGMLIAFVGAVQENAEARVMIIEAQSGKVIYTGGFDWFTNSPAPDTPTNQWNILFPNQNFGLDACIMPPQPMK